MTLWSDEKEPLAVKLTGWLRRVFGGARSRKHTGYPCEDCNEGRAYEVARVIEGGTTAVLYECDHCGARAYSGPQLTAAVESLKLKAEVEQLQEEVTQLQNRTCDLAIERDDAAMKLEDTEGERDRARTELERLREEHKMLVDVFSKAVTLAGSLRVGPVGCYDGGFAIAADYTLSNEVRKPLEALEQALSAKVLERLGNQLIEQAPKERE